MGIIWNIYNIIFIKTIFMQNSKIYEEIQADFEKKKNEFRKRNKVYMILWLILLFILSIPLIILEFMKSYEYVDSFNNISEPIQIPTSGWTTIYANWDIINVDFLAEYDIKWRVLATAQYWENVFEKALGGSLLEDNIIRYKDVWIWWWFLTQDDYVKRFNRTSLSRFLLPEIDSYEDYLYIKDRFTWEDINRHMSHNHLVPANDRIKKLLRWIQKWQFIHIKWYLVRLHSNRWYNLVSSLTREDMGDWACETIYVTDITRLKEK